VNWRNTLTEFTGERLIPGQVDVDLFNEHMARYTFAVRFAGGKRVLDAGCGAGYGSAELAAVAEAVCGVDVAPEAIEFACSHYQSSNLIFQQASVTNLPYMDGSFDLIAAFELIEHLEDWHGFLQETRRVLAPAGRLIVSTPNKLYYTESRGKAGANPFHVHEFEFEEFASELKSVFAHVSLFLENHVEGITFQPHEATNTVEARVNSGEPNPAESHFFVAICARRPQVGTPTFVYVPRMANVLREREHHIATLEHELVKAQDQHRKLLEIYRAQTEDLDKANRWAEDLDVELTGRRARIVELQDELARDQENARCVVDAFNTKVASLEAENQEKTQWALDTEQRLNAELNYQSNELAKAVDVLHQFEKELEVRTAWALRLDKEKRLIEDQLTLVRASRWIKLGRKLGVGPAL
jgi:SAM-dependent methyltransferase